MKYRKLPVETRLTNILRDQGEAAVRTVRTALFEELQRTEGFQLVVLILRELEARALLALRTGIAPEKTDRALGRLECIEEIRASLGSLLPVPQRPSWSDEEEEAFVAFDSSE
jgi:hypothetical protein